METPDERYERILLTIENSGSETYNVSSATIAKLIVNLEQEIGCPYMLDYLTKHFLSKSISENVACNSFNENLFTLMPDEHIEKFRRLLRDANRYRKLANLIVDYKYSDIPFLETFKTDSKYVTLDTLNNVIDSIQDNEDY